MSILPPDLITEILLRLPVKSLIRFQCVSKPWQAQINGRAFIRIHLDFSIVGNIERHLIFMERGRQLPRNFSGVRFNDDDRFEEALVNIHQPLLDAGQYTYIVNYCNGLVCFHNYEGEIVIWNPLIRRYKKLPFEPVGFTDYDLSSSPSLAFGHDPVNDDYKVMRVHEFYRKIDAKSAIEVKVYSLRAHSWKSVEEEWPKEYSSADPSSMSLNGAFHWLVDPFSGSLHRQTLLAFDLATEKFKTYTIPVQSTDDCSLGLEVLKGCICVCVNVNLTLNDVWVMKEYEVVSSWTRLYTIVQGAVPWTFDYCKPLVYSKDGKKVLMEQDLEHLFWYDIEEKRGTRVEFGGMPDLFETAICVGSLVLLDDGDRVNNNPSDGPNLLIEAMEEEMINEEQAV
ncbi:F-box protein CPR1-like [Corylus avellana]|uniref:F-box protein CPR1-like n=1 Tax=Corylus avellana TaxID=13451 RepID=UPI00286C8C09|nr:F-box protein CPR1-like [Corylus avellana]